MTLVLHTVGESDVMINKDRWGYLYFSERGEILRPVKDNQMRRHLSILHLLIKDESWEIEDD